MKSISIGIMELDHNKKRIMTILEQNNMLRKIPHTLKLLDRGKVTTDIIFYKYGLDIVIIERAIEINIFVRYLKADNSTITCKSIVKSVFLRNSNQIIFALLYKVIEFEDFYIYARNDSGYFKIFLNEISYIEVCERATIIHTIDNQVVTYKSLKKYNDLLDHRFARCHASYLVNLDYIRIIKYPDIYLFNGQRILLSKHKSHNFMTYYHNYIRKSTNNSVRLFL